MYTLKGFYMPLIFLLACPSPDSTKICFNDKRTGESVCKTYPSVTVDEVNCFDENGFNTCSTGPVKPKDEYIAPIPKYSR